MKPFPTNRLKWQVHCSGVPEHVTGKPESISGTTQQVPLQTTPLAQVQPPAPSDVVPAGQPPLETQVPDWQVPVALQAPPSFLGVVPQVPPLQTAKLHASLPPQTVPQAPQLVGSPLRYVHVPSHDVEPAGQPVV